MSEPLEGAGEHFVAREREIARLSQYLDLALKGQGQVCFITGDAGSGKSMLVNQFAHRSQVAHDTLLTVIGTCDPQSEGGLPYAPFREILACLTGVVEGRFTPPPNSPAKRKLASFFLRTSQVLVEVGPDLIGTLVPGGVLVAKLGKAMLQKGGGFDRLEKGILRKDDQHPSLSTKGLTQDQLIEQYVNVVRAVAEQVPVLMILEDLHWADNGSAELLFRLIRRIEDRPILIIGTYRPYELQLIHDASQRQLERVLNEIKRYRGDVWLDLNQVSEERGQEFINALLDSEPNRLDGDFRQSLLHHTGGQPLFTVELLRDLQNHGVLVKDEQGQWTVRGPVEWSNIPARVEGVVASRIATLPADARACMEVASVEGEQFTAEVIAHVQGRDAGDLILQLSGDLQRVHQLVEAQEVRHVGLQRISHYRFTHQLFQRYLYHNLDTVKRSFMHEAVGLALEVLYGEHTNDISAQLAYHFETAGVVEKARLYLKRAAEQAVATYANDVALHLLGRALDLAPLDDQEGRFTLLSLRERVYDLLGKRALQRDDLSALESLAVAIGSSCMHAQVALRRSRLAVDMSDYATAIAQAQSAIHSIEAEPNACATMPELHVDGHVLWARALLLSGSVAQSREQWEHALAAAREQGYPPGECRALLGLGGWHWVQSDYANANDAYQQALRLARASGDLRREEEVLNNLGVLATDQQQFTAAFDYYTQARKIAQTIGNRIGESYLIANLGFVSVESGDFIQALTCSEQAVAMGSELGDRMVQGNALIVKGEALCELGLYNQAELETNKAYNLFKASGFRLGEATVLPIIGRIMLAQGHREEALQFGKQALAAARELGSSQEQGVALLHMGRTLADMSCYPEAEQAYAEALVIWRKLGNMARVIGVCAGRADMALARSEPGDLDAALGLVEDILCELTTAPPNSWTGLIPLGVYVTCVQVLQAKHDPRAGQWIAKAKAELEARAARISDAAARQSYLENVPEHRAIQAFHD